MENRELLGLQALLIDGVQAGTLHGIAPPPERGDHPSEKRYQQALERWRLTQCWTVKNIRP